MLHSRRLKNFIFLLFLTALLIVSTLYFSKQVQEQPIYRVIKAAVESETGISVEEILPSPVVPQPSTASTSGQFAVVTKIIDGDTIEIDTGQKLRYIGVNTPEIHHPQKGRECFGTEASEENRKLVEGKRVRLEKDVSEVDRYGRLLRYVWIDDTLINESLVQNGFAYASTYPPDVKYQEKFKVAENQARSKNIGFWSACPQK